MTSQNDSLFSVDSSAATPIYQQLIDQVPRFTAAGVLAPGDRLPSVRAAASALGVNPMTVSKAYAHLAAAGDIVRLPGPGGMEVGGSPKASGKEGVKEREELLIPTLREAAAQARQLKLDPKTAISIFESVLSNGHVDSRRLKARAK